MRKYIFLLLISLLAISCEETIEYQFSESPETIKCDGLNYDLAHEAYYSFRQDLAVYVKSLHIGFNDLNYKESLGWYIYRGAKGNFDFTKIASPHTIKILKELKKNKNLWDTSSGKSNLNYNSEFIDCLIQNIKNDDVRETILSLRASNSFNPSLFSESYRANVFDCYEDNYFGMLIAFDTYYQYIYDLDFNE